MRTAERQLIFKQSGQWQGWFCERCEWNVTLPVDPDEKRKIAAEITQRFEAHRCDDYAPLQTLNRAKTLSHNRVPQLAALTVLLLLLGFPIGVAIRVPAANLAWLAWSLFSFWAVLNAVRLATLAFPVRHSPKHAVLITGLAVVNLLLSLGLAVFPRA